MAKRQRRGRGQGSVYKRSLNGCYYISWYDHRDERQEQLTRTTDRRAAERILAKHVADAALRRDGVIDVRADGYAVADRQPLAEHVTAFEAMLTNKGNTDRHVRETVAHVNRLIGMIEAERISDITEDSVRDAIGKLCSSKLALRTCNSILRSMKTFTGWLKRSKRCRENALEYVQGYNDQTDRRRERRELSEDELARLIQAADDGSKIMGISGADRAMAYRLAVGTGFRASELRSLKPESFDLAGGHPTVTVAAAYSKHRKDDVQPIGPDLAGTLVEWLRGKPRRLPVLGLPPKTAEMMRKDLAEARTKWLEEASTPAQRQEREQSDFLKYKDQDDFVADFHALRHTYVSRVVNGGASVKVAQELARHSSPVLTIGRYAHARLHDLRAGVPNVPEAIRGDEVVRATGTDGRKCGPEYHSPPAKPLAHACEEPDRPSEDLPQQPPLKGHGTVRTGRSPDETEPAERQNGKSRKSVCSTGLDGSSRCRTASYLIEADGSRTRNHRIDSPVL